MTRLLPILLLVAGCQSAPVRMVTSPESAMACHVADGLTTAIAIQGGAVEANPLMAPVVSALGPWGFFAFKIGIGYLAYRLFRDVEDTESRQWAIGVHNLVICGAAVNNAVVIGRQ